MKVKLLQAKIEDIGYRDSELMANCKHEWEKAWCVYMIHGSEFMGIMHDSKCKFCKISKHDWLLCFPTKFSEFTVP